MYSATVTLSHLIIFSHTILFDFIAIDVTITAQGCEVDANSLSSPTPRLIKHQAAVNEEISQRFWILNISKDKLAWFVTTSPSTDFASAFHVKKIIC